MDEDHDFKVLWTICLVAGIASLALIALYYWRHPERRIIEDFDPARFTQAPGPTPDPGVEADPGIPPGSEAGAA